jgi:hypothetical protein
VNLFQDKPPVGKSADGGSSTFGSEIKGKKPVKVHMFLANSVIPSEARNLALIRSSSLLLSPI